MKKTINKIVGLFSLGLLLFAAQTSYANSETQEFFQDAWQFMEKHAEDGGAEFRKSYGKDAGELEDYVHCGETRCNLRYRRCMVKERKLLPNKYVCVSKDEVNSYKKSGYKESEGQNKIISAMKDLKKECYNAKNTTGNVTRYCARKIGDRVEIMAAQKKKRACEVVEVSWYNNSKCFFCFLLGEIYAVADTITITAQQAFARSFAIVIVVGLAVWLAFKTLAFVSSPTKQDIAKYITELLIQSFKFLIAFFALLYYRQIFTMLILPLINSGMDFGTKLVGVQNLESRVGKEVFSALVTAGTTGDGSALLGMQGIQTDYLNNANNKFFNVYTYAKMENFAYNVNLQYSLLQTIGGSLVCTGFKIITGAFDVENGGFGLGIASIVYGICFGIFGFLLSIAFVFYLLDVVVQLGIVGALLPFLVAAWPFKLTSQYTKKGFDMLLNSIFVFMMMGVVVNLSMSLISVAVEYNTNTEGASGDVGETGLAGLIRALSEIDTTKLSYMVNIISIGFLLFLVANIMSMLLLSKTQEFAGQFANTPLPPMASDLATKTASTAFSAAKKTGGAIISSVGGGFGEGTKELRDKVKEKTKEFVDDNIKDPIKHGVRVAKVAVGRKFTAGMNKTKVGRAIMEARNRVVNAEREYKKEQAAKRAENLDSYKKVMGSEGEDNQTETINIVENQGGSASEKFTPTEAASHDRVKMVVGNIRGGNATAPVSILAACLQCKDLSDEERKKLERTAVNTIAKMSKGQLDPKRGSFEGRCKQVADFEYLLGVVGKNPDNKQLVESKAKMLKDVKSGLLNELQDEKEDNNAGNKER